jgi:hypothetical protein
MAIPFTPELWWHCRDPDEVRSRDWMTVREELGAGLGDEAGQVDRLPAADLVNPGRFSASVRCRMTSTPEVRMSDPRDCHLSGLELVS